MTRTPTLTVVGGLVAATLDISYAFWLGAIRGTAPLRVLQSVASGIQGPLAYQGGWTTGLVGLLLHYGIALVAAVVYASAASQLRWLRKHYLWAGSLFGVVVYVVMNFVVLPLSAVPFQIVHTPRVLLQGFVSHALLVGLPIAASLHLAHRGQRQPGQLGQSDGPAVDLLNSPQLDLFQTAIVESLSCLNSAISRSRNNAHWYYWGGRDGQSPRATTEGDRARGGGRELPGPRRPRKICARAPGERVLRGAGRRQLALTGAAIA